jgi:hypothetical protein
LKEWWLDSDDDHQMGSRGDLRTTRHVGGSSGWSGSVETSQPEVNARYDMVRYDDDGASDRGQARKSGGQHTSSRGEDGSVVGASASPRRNRLRTPPKGRGSRRHRSSSGSSSGGGGGGSSDSSSVNPNSPHIPWSPSRRSQSRSRNQSRSQSRSRSRSKSRSPRPSGGGGGGGGGSRTSSGTTSPARYRSSTSPISSPGAGSRLSPSSPLRRGRDSPSPNGGRQTTPVGFGIGSPRFVGVDSTMVTADHHGTFLIRPSGTN